MRGGFLFLLGVAALMAPPALAADPPYKKVTAPVAPRARPQMKSDAGKEAAKPAPDIPLDMSKAVKPEALSKLPSTASQLDTLKAEVARDKPAVDTARQKSEQLSTEAKSLRQKLIATAAKIESLEQETVYLGEEIDHLEHQNAELTEGFRRDRISVTRLLAILERLQHDMPPALAVRPDDALAAARGAMLVGASLPPVYAEAARLARRIETLKKTRISLLARRVEATKTASELTAARTDLEVLTTQKESEAQTAGDEYDTLKSRLAEIASKAADFQTLANRIAALRRGGNGDDGITIVTASNSGALGPLSKGSLLRPVVGTAAPPGTDPEENRRNPGITYVTADNAQVIAPIDGRVLFAGPYHKSGQVLILEITTGYDLVLAGLGRINVRLNDEVLAGEPVGNMPVQSGAPKERLYFELRQNGHGLDPKPWLALDPRKAKGS
ncbi:MAG TPA: peptidoglycan DD-metalloendopeptidase family protein [Rhizomicrobium sp.]